MTGGGERVLFRRKNFEGYGGIEVESRVEEETGRKEEKKKKKGKKCVVRKKESLMTRVGNDVENDGRLAVG